VQIRYGRAVAAGLVALGALLIAHWFDAGVLADAQVRAGYSYDVSPLADLTVVAHLATAGGVVAIAIAGWRSRSLAVGFGYAVVGGFLAFLPALFWALAVQANGAPTVAPEPIASTLGRWFFTVQTGVTGAVYTLGAAMLLTGLAVLWSVLSERNRVSAVAAPVPDAAAAATDAASMSGPA
jgi:hypothetical protein